jgi:hypothetical protein
MANSVDVAGATSTSRTVSGLTIGTTYYFQVMTINGSGGTSAPSGVGIVTVQ